MATIYKILGYTIWIGAGLISLYGGWIYLVDTVGWVDPIIFSIFSPFEIAIVPFILAFQGHFQLLIITYGGCALGYFFIATANRLERKSLPNTSKHSTSYKESNFASNKIQLQKSNYQPGEQVITNIVGVTFEGRQNVIDKLAVGDNVFLKREPNNTYDPNAITVLYNRYTKEEQEKIKLEIAKKYDATIKSIYDQSHNLLIEKIKIISKPPYGQDKDDKIVEIDTTISQLDETRKKLERERTEAFINQYETVQVGYINKELANLIAPIFDQWACDPAKIVEGKVIRLTGIDKPGLSHGATIQFRLPDENSLELAMYRATQFYI